MSPNLRRAAHQALDLILDAWAEEQRAEPKKKKTRGPVLAVVPELPKDVTPEELATAKRAWSRAGYR